MIKLKSVVFRLKLDETYEELIKRVDKFIEEKYNEGFSINEGFPSDNIVVVTYWREK